MSASDDLVNGERDEFKDASGRTFTNQLTVRKSVLGEIMDRNDASTSPLPPAILSQAIIERDMQTLKESVEEIYGGGSRAFGYVLFLEEVLLERAERMGWRTTPEAVIE